MKGIRNKPKVLMITARADYGGGPKHVYLLIKYLSAKIDFFVHNIRWLLSPRPNRKVEKIIKRVI